MVGKKLSVSSLPHTRVTGNEWHGWLSCRMAQERQKKTELHRLGLVTHFTSGQECGETNGAGRRLRAAPIPPGPKSAPPSRADDEPHPLDAVW